MLNDNVGKKIVEALKMQNESIDIQDNPSTFENPYTSGIENLVANNTNTASPEVEQKEIYQNQFNNDFNASSMTIDNVFAQNLSKNTNSFRQNIDIDLPANVTVLNNLISKLPVGVSKQTGALIIKQTMEAIGIPMASVLQEAKQVQDSLTANALECQKNIIEYKKQITILEQKAQSLQKQAVAMNDIISLFAKTN